MNEWEIKLKKAKERTLRESEEVLGNNILLGVAIATIDNFEKNIIKELKNGSTKSSK